MIALAIATGIPMDDWLDAGEQAIVTAMELMAESRADRRDGDGRQG